MISLAFECVYDASWHLHPNKPEPEVPGHVSMHETPQSATSKAPLSRTGVP